MKSKKNKRTKKNGLFRGFRFVISTILGAVGAFVFPNFIITHLAMWTGILVGKGIISYALAEGITIFLGSQAGIWLQTAIFGGLSFLASNVALTIGEKVGKLFLGKNNSSSNNRIRNYSQERKTKQAVSMGVQVNKSNRQKRIDELKSLRNEAVSLSNDKVKSKLKTR